MKVAIFGTVGAGKTTLIKELQKLLPDNYEIFWEPLTQNPYFEPSYSPDINIARSATYKMELFMLAARFKQFKESKQFKNVIYDRGIMDTIIFADCNFKQGRLDQKDWNVYKEYFEISVIPSIIAKNNYDGYDLVVYLKVDAETSIQRIKNRGIKRELDVDDQFWTMLVSTYDEWYERLKDKMPFLVVDGKQENPQQYAKQVADKINQLKENKH